MRAIVKVLVGLLLLVLLVGVGVYGWATVTSNRALARTFEVHEVDFPVPFPPSNPDVEDLAVAAGEASQQAIERGRHLVDSRYFCTECHGQDLGGGVMVDAFPIGTLLGPNLTTGAGSRTLEYSTADWDRIVRHGILPDGRPAVMPSEEFEFMTDQELSDIVAYVRSFPAVENSVPEPRLGPLGKLLVSLGEIRLSAEVIGSHTADHAAYPPPTEVSLDFGRHLSNICSGCHGENLSGGPVAGGDPGWPDASNITPHADGIGSWDYQDFTVAMREAMRPDGMPLAEPMSGVVLYTQRMSETELQAMWTYLQSVPPAETGVR